MDTLRLQVILDGIDRATAPLQGILKGTGNLSRAVKEARDRLKELNTANKQLESFRSTTARVTETAQALTAARDRLKGLRDEIVATDNPAKALTDRYKAAGAELRELERAHAAATAAQATATADMQRAGIPVTELANRQRTLAAQITAATAALERQGQQMQRVKALQASYRNTLSTRDKIAGAGVATGAVGAATGAGVLATLKAYAEAEDAGTRLAASMMQAGGKVPAQYQQINDLATRLGDKLPGTTADYQNMMQMLIRQGMSAKAILGGLGEATALLAVQLDMPKTAAAEFASKLQDSTRTAEADMLKLMDTIQRTYYLGVDPNNMGAGFAKLSPALSIIRKEGLAAAQALAPLLVLADQSNMDGSASGNAFRKVFQASMNSTKINDTNGTLGGIMGQKFKLQFSDGKGEFAGLDNMFTQLAKLKQLNTEQRQEIIRSIYGDDSEVMQVVTIMIEKGKAAYDEVAAKMQAQADLQARVNAQLGTLRSLWEATTGTFTNLLASLGETIAPQVKTLTEWIGNVAGNVRQWASDNPRLAGTLMQIAAFIAVTTTAVGALLLAVAAVLGPLALMRFALGAMGLPSFITLLSTLASVALPAVGTAFKTAGAIALRAIAPIAAAIAATPIGWIVAGAVMLAGTAALVYKYWEPIKAFMQGFWEGLSAAAGPALSRVWEGVKGLMSALGDLLLSVNPIRVAFELLSAVVKPILDVIASGLSRVWDWLKRLLSPVEDVNGAARGMGKVWGQAAGEIINALLSIPARALEIGKQIITNMASGIREKIAAVKEVLSTIGYYASGGSVTRNLIASTPITTQAPLRAGGGNTTVTTNAPITINAAPGQSPQDVGRAVRDALDARDRQRAALRRSTLADAN